MGSVFNKTSLTKGIQSREGILPAETALYNANHILELEHVPTQYKIKFPAYLENFSDAYTQSWNAEDVYGRMDPIAVYQNTRRAIAMSWKVPADSIDHARENMDAINVLMSFMYPLYQGSSVGDGNQGTVINSGPLMRIKFANLIYNAAFPDKGLMGYINGFTVDVGTENGIFIDNNGPGYNAKGYYPKEVTLNFELNVLHEHPMGWLKQGGGYVWRGKTTKGYPYATANPIPGMLSSATTATEPVAAGGLPGMVAPDGEE